MRWFLVLLLIVASLWSTPAQAAGDEQYVEIYLVIQEADQLLATQLQAKAKQKYLDALGALTVFQKTSPEWNPNAVKFRLEYVNAKLAGLKSVLLDSEKPEQAEKGKPAPAVVDPTAPFKDTIARLEGEKTLLAAKLQEALTAQPASVDPRELTKAEARIKEFEKARDSAAATLAAAQASTSKLEQELKAKDLEAGKVGLELHQLKAALEESKNKSKSASALKDAEAKIESLRQQVAANDVQRSALAKEKEKVEALRAENQVLKNRASAAVPKAGVDKTQSNKSQKEIATLQARLKVLEAVTVPYTAEELALFKAPPVNLKTVEPRNAVAPKVVEKKEPDPRGKRVLTAIQWPWRNGSKRTTSPAPEVEVVAPTAQVPQGKPPVRALPQGAANLVAEAQRAFGSGQFDVAEQKYLEVLKMDEKNTVVLANLAAINLQQNHLPQADERLTVALGLDPSDAHLQSLMGILRFRQDKIDESIDYLSKASTADPKDSETQNYLGIALSQKGQRGPAEKAFRRAIQLNPNYAGAHYNLSMAYTTSQPPALELARFHYKKAIGLGYPANPAVEKMFQGN